MCRLKKIYLTMWKNKTMSVKQIVKHKVFMYSLCIDMCLEAADKIRQDELETELEAFEKKRSILQQVMERREVVYQEDMLHVRVEYTGCCSMDFEELGYVIRSKEIDNTYVCMFLRFDKNEDDKSMQLSCIRCETTDSNISISFTDYNGFVASEVEFPCESDYRSDDYAIWAVNRTDPWQEQYICNYVLAFDETFDSFYLDYCDEWGERVGDFNDDDSLNKM